MVVAQYITNAALKQAYSSRAFLMPPHASSTGSTRGVFIQ
jgi:hypothetical protein